MSLNVTEWLMTPYPAGSAIWLLISSISSLFFGFLASWLTFNFIKKKELIAETAAEVTKHEQELKAEIIAEVTKHQQLLAVDWVHSKKERINQEVIKWSNPILLAVNELNDRVINILKSAYDPLNEDFMPNPRWSITYEYFMNTTLFIFGQYYAWIRMMEEEINREIFSTKQKKAEFFKNIEQCSEALSSTDLVSNLICITDRQVFRQQQRAIGELFIVHENNHERCLTYPEFCKKMKDDDFKIHIEPLIGFLNGINPDDLCRWHRMEILQQGLEKLKEACENVLESSQIFATEPVIASPINESTPTANPTEHQ